MTHPTEVQFIINRLAYYTGQLVVNKENPHATETIINELQRFTNNLVVRPPRTIVWDDEDDQDL